MGGSSLWGTEFRFRDKPCLLYFIFLGHLLDILGIHFKMFSFSIYMLNLTKALHCFFQLSNCFHSYIRIGAFSVITSALKKLLRSKIPWDSAQQVIATEMHNDSKYNMHPTDCKLHKCSLSHKISFIFYFVLCIVSEVNLLNIT